MALSERAFQEMVVQAARLSGLAVYHTYDSRRSEPGYPDLTIVGSRGVLMRELKTDTGRLSQMQRYWLTVLRDAGVDASVWRPSQWPEPIMSELKALGRLTIKRPSPRIPGQRQSGQRSQT